MHALRRIGALSAAGRACQSVLSRSATCTATKTLQPAVGVEVNRGFATLADAANQARNSLHTQKYLNYGLAALAGGGAVYLLTRGRGRDGDQPSVARDAAESATKLMKGEGTSTKPQYNPELADVKPFNAVDHMGQPFTHKDLLGDFVVVIFGDPDSSLADRQFDRLSAVINDVDRKSNMQYTVPLIVAIEPSKTEAPAMKKFVDKHASDFQSRKNAGRSNFKGATGAELEHLKDAVVKSVDGYFSDLKQVMAVLDPEGRVTGVFNEKKQPGQVADEVAAQIKEFRGAHPMWHYPKGVKDRYA